MGLPKIAIVTESPDDCIRTWDTVEMVMEVLEKEYELDRVSILDAAPKNGKAATKTEMRQSEHKRKALLEYKYLIVVGNTPLQIVTGKSGISKVRGRPIEIGETVVLPINNPSIIRHDPNQEAVLERDLDLFRDIVEFGGIPEEEELSIRLVLTKKDFDEMTRDLRGFVSYDIETNSLNPFQTHEYKTTKAGVVKTNKPAKIVSIGFGTRNHQWIIPMNMANAPWNTEQVSEMLQSISDVLDDCFIIAHNGKFDALWTWVHLGIKLEIAFDTMMAHFLLDENSRHGLKYLAQKYLGAPDWEVDLNTKQGAASIDKMVKYHAHDLYYTRELKSVFLRTLKKDPDVHFVFDNLMMPSVNLFVEIEYDGVFIDESKFDEAEDVLRSQYNEALASLKQWEPKNLVDDRGKPYEFNWGSSQQLGDLLFKRLKLPVIERTDAGNPSCSESVIKRLNHPCTEALLKFREAKQQLSFFIDGWKPFLHYRKDGAYLHPSFKLHGTVTGRLSCENPNLQQVPRDPRIRTLISAPDGWTLVECDLSQIELRIAAELANEASMIYAFTHGIDIHWLTAIREIERAGGMKDLVLDTARTWKQDKKIRYSEAIETLLEMGPNQAVEVNSAWKEIRKKAKAINFGYLYGMWWKKFKDYARDNYGLSITDEEAEESRETFFENYSDLPEWHKRQKRFAHKNGYVTTLSGRKRRLPAATASDNTPERKAAERQAINSPVQSFANDLNLMAALQLRREFGRNIVKICGTVHDAVLFRVRNDWVERVYNRMMEIMRRPSLMNLFDITMTVPIEADGKIGPWGAGVSLNKWKDAQNAKKVKTTRATARAA